jgi:hypothetical protein
MALHNDWPISDRYWAILTTCYKEHCVNNNKCVIDTHIILVRVVRSIQNYCIKYFTQDQHFAKMFTYCTLTILIITWISIILLFQFNWDFIYSAIIHVSDVSDDPDRIFACWVQCRSQRPPSTKHPEFALPVAAVDTRRVLRPWETTARGM